MVSSLHHRLVRRGLAALACCSFTVSCVADDELPAQDEDDGAPGGAVADELADVSVPEPAVGDRGEQVARAYAYLKQYGYFPNPELERLPGWKPVVEREPEDPQVFDEALEEAVASFQEAHGLVVDGTLNAETQRLMSAPRCGFPDHYAQPRPLKGPAQYAPSGQKWGDHQVLYRFRNFSPDLSQDDIRGAVAEAFARWSAVTDLLFYEDSDADIEISFGAGNHGDNWPFDGQGSVLAHAWPPGSGIGGDIHFDEAETWALGGGTGVIDLRSVALHEIGHALGLDHSDDTEAVMYAFYQDPKPNLRHDDVLGIQSIYGERLTLSWSAWGPIPGKHCIQVAEYADPYAWDDNYFCSDKDIGAQWSMSGPIPGMRCTQIVEPADPDTWNDNYLCVPVNSKWFFNWRYDGPDRGNRCVQWHEFADPHTWDDNFLCSLYLPF
ncbi:matrixin family metalloprotease [Nannocystis punicea]|uniref:Matrixin family metalloprotease n=1 Tax=Nannocystis punicea TaxID=2995304 RepID=A0ABY7GWC2_9BACT|nr:matrixin family metalloprotease [Nannocystis poenicansa]WAS91275.1 matrixin family metalloprotease [Nannocystis poenicansa]